MESIWDYPWLPTAELHVCNLPPLWLRQRADAEGRSMSAEAVVILRAVLQSAQSGTGRSQTIVQLRAIRQQEHLGAGTPLGEEVIRTDVSRATANG